jgi:hypothetical protein
MAAAPAAPRPVPDPARQEEFEARFEAAPAVVAIMALQVAIGLVSRAEHWTLWRVQWWGRLLGIGPEAVLLVPLVFDRLTPADEAAIAALAGTRSLRSLAADFGVSLETVRAAIRDAVADIA